MEEDGSCGWAVGGTWFDIRGDMRRRGGFAKAFWL